MEIVVCGDRQTVTGFRLAGIRRAYELPEAHERFNAILADQSVAIVVVTERFAAEHSGSIEAHRSARRAAPIVVAIPDRSGPTADAAAQVRALIRKALGADLGRADGAP